MRAIGRIEFGLGDDEFGRIGTERWNSLTAYFRERQELGDQKWDQRVALLCCVVANRSLGPDESPHRLDEFMPSYISDEEITEDEMMAQARAFNIACGGTEV